MGECGERERGRGRGREGEVAPETAHEFPLDERNGHCCEDRRRCESCADAGDESQRMRESEMPPGIRLTQLDMLEMEDQETASQIQAMKAMRQVEEEEKEKAKRARIDAVTSPKRSSLTESLNNAANSIIKDQKPETHR